MSLETWLSFIVACSVLCFTPGPTVLLVVGQSFVHGRKSSIPLVLGVLCGDIIALTLSLVGVGTILAMSSDFFIVMKWCGAGYLIYLGLKAIRAKPDLTESAVLSDVNNDDCAMKVKAFRQSLIVTALNPKGIIFFMAFFPLFIDPSSPLISQLIVLSLSFICVSGLSASTYAIAARSLISRLNSPKVKSIFNRVSGGMLVSAGLLTANLQKNA
ncbi:LysE family translocator [Thalassotalea fusca]